MSERSQQHTNRPARAVGAVAVPAIAARMPAEEILLPAGAEFCIAPTGADPLEFSVAVEFEAVSPALSTTGWEEYDDPELAVAAPAPAEAAFALPEAPLAAVESVTAQPVIVEPTVKASPLVFEAIEVMDYDEDEDGYFFEERAAQPEAEPELPPPPMAAAVAVAPVQPAAPVPAKTKQGAGAAPFSAADTILPEVALPTLRPKLLRGKNPFATAPKPEAPPPPPAEPIPAPKPAAVQAAPAAPATKPAPMPPAPRKPEINVRPSLEKEGKRTPPVPPAPVSRPAMAARDRGNAVPVQRDEPIPPPPPAPQAAPAAAPKPKVMEMPSRRAETTPEPAAPAASAPPPAAPALGMPEPSGGMSSGVKIGIAAAVLAAVLGGGYFMFSGGKSSTRSAAAEESISDTPSSLIVGGGGWTTTWGIDAPNNKGKQISIYRPSMAMTDYRFEFRGQIERKALGWIFRASNPKNYYVMKLETIKPGANPLVALVKYAVVEGKETTRTQVMLPFEVKLDTLYQVRLDVRGDKFSTYVQGKLVDFWTDNRIKVGGAGFYNDPGERAAIKTSQLSYLTSAGK